VSTLSEFNKPYQEISDFAKNLGWRGIRVHFHFSPFGLVTVYHTTHRKFFLQINEHPIGSTSTYAAAVYADCYGICCGFFPFRLNRDSQHLRNWLFRKNYRDSRWRRMLRREYPQFCITNPTPRTCNIARRTGLWPPLLPLSTWEAVSEDEKCHRPTNCR
jgi:hypothetical protein